MPFEWCATKHRRCSNSRLAKSHAALFGVPTEKDITLLAGRLGLDWEVQIVPDNALDPEIGD